MSEKRVTVRLVQCRRRALRGLWSGKLTHFRPGADYNQIARRYWLRNSRSLAWGRCE